ncbi:MAG: 4Fe-4S dicluster domain-containing protein [Spirochaetia bacterium]|jgi:Na(+)-translocating NADH:ubiquinone oxidoreductase A subunit|nr:4Fe-4S dicluster domain-containing protein [Spirochaetia bacterium]
MRGGYTPKIDGRPSSILKKIALSSSLTIDLHRNERFYKPLVEEGQRVKIGDLIASADLNLLIEKGDSIEENDPVEKEAQVLYLPSPADGIIHLNIETETGKPFSIILSDIGSSVDKNPQIVKDPNRLTPIEARKVLVERGIWQYIWSSGTNGIADISGKKKPKAIVINTIIAEPFRTRGKVILNNFWHSIIKGLSYLPLLLEDYGTIEFILTEKKDPIVQLMLKELTGKAWVKFHFVDVKYPIEKPEILNKLIRKEKNRFNQDNEIWVVDIQTVEAIGICLGKGVPMSRRIVAMGGPAFPDPMHINVRIGTPLKDIIPENINLNTTLVLRGGLFLGEPVDPENSSVGFDDDAFFFIPVKQTREFLSFIKPGFSKRSIFPNFAGRIDRDLSSQLRGELRPCIACGKCQEVCPVNLMPQIIHRYLYTDRLDEAQKLGLDNCIECNLCTFVCTSKIELKVQFVNAKNMLLMEQEGNL